MNKIAFIFTLIVGVSMFNCSRTKHSASQQELNIIPKPLCQLAGEGHFSLNSATVFVCPPDQELEQLAKLFFDKIAQSSGIHVKPALKKGASNYIVLTYDQQLNINEEGYILIVSTKSITIKCKTARGAFYAMQTLMQLLPPEIESTQLVDHVKWTVPCVNIKDEPRFSWRGIHLDAGRHFMSVDFIKKQLDVLALFKINKFHWHLTEDQGWRIEIKKHPKLTSIGAQRIEGDGSIHQGFYTQAQIKEVVAYAKSRFIDIIPEIEMPGHALACLAAYPNLSCTGGPFIPRNIWGVESEVFCAGNEETFQFLEDVFTEIIPLFPYEYIHIGGDECPKDRWEACAKCKARMKDEGLKNTHELQAYFIQRIEKTIRAKGKKMIGWDEILEGEISPSATVMSWRGEEGGIAGANKGHDVIMSPSKFVYLNYYQGDRKTEPTANDYDISAEHIYQYEPIPEKILPDKAKHILGAQACLWTEYIYEEPIAEYQLYPRAIAMAELTWSSKAQRNYSDFTERLSHQWTRLNMHHINYYIPLPEGPTAQIACVDSVTLSFSTPGKIDKIVYTTDGSMPNNNSSVYHTPLTFYKNTTLRIASLQMQGKMSTVRTITIENQAYRKAVPLTNSTKGLRCKSSQGYYLNVADIRTVNQWTEGIIDSMSQANSTLNWGNAIDPKNFKAVELNGYIDVPEDAVYFFSSDQDQVWIADQLIVNNDGVVKRFSRHDGSIALAKGKHKLKIIYLNNIIGGWPSDWNSIQVKFRKSQDKEFSVVSPEMCSYQP